MFVLIEFFERIQLGRKEKKNGKKERDQFFFDHIEEKKRGPVSIFIEDNYHTLESRYGI